VSSRELVDAYLERIDQTRDLNAFITVAGTRARRAADAADRRLRSGEEAPLLGIPLTVKDLFATKEMRTTAGSRILKRWQPGVDATPVQRFRQAGAVLLGKTNLHEFAYGITTGNPHWGVARNPWDRDRIPGGSSGGSAIAVVAGLCAGSLGSDTGGSIRIPAAVCGCVGLKPTFGAVPLDGCWPLAPSLDHAGPLARTVADVANLFSVLSGRAARRVAARGLRVGVPDDYFFEQIEPGVRHRVQSAISALGKAGMRVISVRIPSMRLGVATQLITIRAEAAAVHARWIARRAREYGGDTRIRLYLGSLVAARDYLLAQQARTQIRDTFVRLFERIDLLATPTVPLVAPRIGERTVRWGRVEEPVDGALVRLTSVFNLTGLPALSLPCGLSRGLPVGLQLVAPWGQEARLLAVGAAVERLQGTIRPDFARISSGAR